MGGMPYAVCSALVPAVTLRRFTMPPLLRRRTPGKSLFLLSALVVLWVGSACGPSGMGPTPTSTAASAPDTPTTASVLSAVFHE